MRLSILIILVLASVARSSPPADYENALKDVREDVSKTKNLHSFDDAHIINNLEIIEFKDLPATKKKVFYIIRFQEIGNNTLFLKKAWEKEIVADKKDKDATTEEIAAYILKLDKLRKENAINFEKFIDEWLVDTKDFSEREIKSLKRSVYEWHDKEHLIERKKENGEVPPNRSILRKK